MWDKLKFPTELHRSYLLNLQDLCIKKGLTLVVKGSISKRTATEFSDIDILILGDVSQSSVDDIISCYGKPVMTNYTENPKGILILVYENGVSVDLEFRISIASYEIQESVVLVGSVNSFISGEDIIRREIVSEYFPEREQWYKDLRLGHRALIKFLSNNEEVALDLLKEMKEKFANSGLTDL